MNSFYIVTTEHEKFGKFTYENDHIAKPAAEQLVAIAELVWSGEWDNVVSCHLIDPKAGTCTDAMKELALAVEARCERNGVEVHGDTTDFIERVLGREAWAPTPESAKANRITAWAKSHSHWVP